MDSQAKYTQPTATFRNFYATSFVKKNDYGDTLAKTFIS
jgi:hypothetical protein